MPPISSCSGPVTSANPGADPLYEICDIVRRCIFDVSRMLWMLADSKREVHMRQCLRMIAVPVVIIAARELPHGGPGGRAANADSYSVGG